jgi:hypothetical protein
MIKLLYLFPTGRTLCLCLTELVQAVPRSVLESMIRVYGDPRIVTDPEEFRAIVTRPEKQ